MSWVEKIKNNLLMLILILTAAQFLILFPQSFDQNQSPFIDPISTNPSSEYNQKMTGVHLVESADSHRDWEMFSKEAFGNQESGKWEMGGVKINIYNQNKIEFIVDGERGFVAGEKQDILIEGNVKIRSENGYILDCTKARYVATSRELIGEGPIRVYEASKNVKEKFSLTGSSLKILVPKSKMYIQGPVKSIRELSDGKRVLLFAERAMLSSINSEATFYENLKIDYNNFLVHGQEAQLKFEEKDKILERLTIRGGVSLQDSLRKATSDSVDIDFKTKNISLNGNPYVVSGEDEMRGEKIILVNGGRKIIVDKIKAKMDKLQK